MTAINNVTNQLILSLGLDIDPSGKLYDQDTGEYLSYRGKNFRYSKDPGRSLYLTKNDIPFNPLASPKIMEMLTKEFLTKIVQNNEADISTYYTVSYNNCTGMEAKNSTGNIIYKTHYYMIDTLKYAEFIICISGYPFDYAIIKQADIELAALKSSKEGAPLL